MDTFVESYDFGNATVIPFCTSSSSGIGKSSSNLADLAVAAAGWMEKDSAAVFQKMSSSHGSGD